LLVADDVGNSVWRVQGTAPRPARKTPQPQSQTAPPPPVQQEPPASPPPEQQPAEVTSQAEPKSQPAAESAPEPQSTASLTDASP